MADKKITDLNQANTVNATDLLVVVQDPAGSAVTKKMTVNTFFSNVASITVANSLIIPTRSTPANSTALTITSGSMFYDGTSLYVAVANNTLRRVTLNTF